MKKISMQCESEASSVTKNEQLRRRMIQPGELSDVRSSLYSKAAFIDITNSRKQCNE